MSVQSDIEMLSIQAIEVYAKRRRLSGEAVVDLFHRRQVFEKMLIQHEYLHQVDFEEVMEYIDKIIEEDSKELVVYHGSCSDFDKIDLSKSHNRRDFGKGFYTTILESQSEEWAYRRSLREKAEKYYVYKYLFMESEALRVKRFDSLSKNWLEFIKDNRSRGGLQHEYDVVIGPMADDRTMETIQLYIADILTATEAMERLKYSKANNQISFHTAKALEHLRLVGRKTYE